jgi:uncharacterized protein
VNVLVSALLRPIGAPGLIVDRLLREQAFELVVSVTTILSELRRALHYPRVRQRIAASGAELNAWVEALSVIADVVDEAPNVTVVAADPEDDKYIAAALAGRAAYVVNGDKHLLDVGRYEDVRIVTPREFLEILADVVRE